MRIARTLRAGAQSLAGGLRRGFVVRLLRRRARAFLEDMPDYLLADIGLTRAEIPEAVERMIARDHRDMALLPPASKPAAEPSAPLPELRRAA